MTITADNIAKRRKSFPLDDQLSDQLSDPKQNIDTCMQVTFENRQVRECLSQLPKQYQILLSLKYIEEISVKQIARIVDKSPKSVESMLGRARSAFIRQYREMEGSQNDRE